MIEEIDDRRVIYVRREDMDLIDIKNFCRLPDREPRTFVWSPLAVAVAAQAGMVALAAMAGWWFGGWSWLEAATLGGAVALLNVLQSAWLLRVCAPASRPGLARVHLGLGAAQRFALTVGVFAVALGWLHLPAPPLLAAFAAAQLGHLAGQWKGLAAARVA